MLENQFKINICRLKIAFRHNKPLNFAAVELEEEIRSKDDPTTRSTECYVRQCMQKLDGKLLSGHVLHCDLLTDHGRFGLSEISDQLLNDSHFVTFLSNGRIDLFHEKEKRYKLPFIR